MAVDTNLLPPAPDIIQTPGAARPLPGLREFGDAAATRKNIYDHTLGAVSGIEPMSDDRHTLRLTGVGWQDPERFTKRQRKRAVLTGETLARRLRGTWELVDNATGNVLQRRQQVVARVPYLSSAGTFTHRGNEYTVSHQQRLLPGAFARVKDNGEVESHFNILPGKGVSHRYFLDPEKGQFKLRLGQAEMPLMPLLQAMGASDREVQDAWGVDLWQANAARNDASVIKKLGARLLRNRDGHLDDPAVTARRVAEAFAAMELDPEVTRRTLGHPHTRVTKEAVLAATRKLLGVARGEVEPDDRDALPYQTFLGPEDLFRERVQRDHGNARRRLFREVSRAGSLDKMPSGALTPQIEQVLLGSGLAQALEEINPAEVLDKQSRITRMGEGGIPSLDAIPDEARSVQPSHMGFMDPLRTPESFRVGVDLNLASGVRKGDDGRLYVQLVDKGGKRVWKSPQDLADAAMTTADTLKWPSKRVPVMRGGRLEYVPKAEVDYVLPEFERAFSHLGNLVPLKSAVKGQRMAMASRMLTQALPLVNAEAPLVQSGLPGSGGARSFEEEYGRHMGAVHADRDGVVEAAGPGEIRVRYADGKTDTIELYDHHPYNRKSVTGDTQIFVKRGTKIWSTPIAEYEWATGDLTLSIDPATKKSAWMPVTGYLKHRNDKRLLRVTTESGRAVVVTEDHSLITLDDDGELSPVYPKDCVVGRTRLPIARLPELPAGAGNHHASGRLVGLYLSEGHCPPSQPGLVTIAVKDEVRAEQVMRLIRSLGYSPYRNGGCVCFTDKAKCAYLTSNFGHLSHNKVIPGWVLHAPITFRLGVICGYMGGDGCLWEDGNGAVQVAAVSVSKALRDGMVDLLSSVGVFTTLWNAPRNHLNDNWRDGYGFRVISRHLARVNDWFFYTDRERKLRDLMKVSYRSSPFEAVPVPSAAARKVLYAGMPEVPAYVHKTASQGAVAKERLTENTGVYGQWGRSDVLWDRIVDIALATDEEYVYDLCVERAEAFAVCHGLVVHNTYIHQTPVIAPGTRFKAGDLLARSNYTDHTGATALGTNLRVAYTPHWGYNFEDAIVVSASAAEKLASEHMYQHDLEVTDRHKMGKGAFVNLFPAKFDRAALARLDDRGVVLPGTEVRHGDPLVLAARERDRAQNKIHKKGQAGYTDESVLWKHHDPGVVTDVVWGKNGPVVLVKSVSRMQVGDKMSGRYGDKGVVADIVPDGKMPHDKDGNPFEVLLNPMGTITRTNPAQHVEAMLGKIAAKTGRPVKVPDFEDVDDLTAWAQRQLLQHGLSDTEDIVHPGYGVKVPVQTGHRFFMKLHHTAESKGQGRGAGAYSADETPAKGGETGSKRISMLDVNALLSHGAVETLKDAGSVRGQKNDRWWLQFMSGHAPADPRVPMRYEKFVNQLRAAGINPVRTGHQVHVMALTGRDVDRLAEGRVIRSGDTVRFDQEMRPVRGGLFDEQLTGGHGGRRWAAIELPEPLPNPVMEEPVRRVLGLTQKQFEGVISGDHHLPKYGTGPKAIAAALGAMDLDREVNAARAEYRAATGARKDAALRRWDYLAHAQKAGLHPRDWVLDKVPVLPPAFRPVSVMGASGLPLVSDPNYLYKELLDAAANHREMEKELGPDGVGPERLAVYHAFKAVTGLGDPVHPKLQEKNVKGVLKSVFGDSPKFGTVQRKLLSSTVDNVGRAVITPNPDFDMDTVGVPEGKAFEVYEKFVVRQLRRRGMPVREALRQVRDKTPLAREVLQAEMDSRPVYINRAPVLHKFGIMAFRPRLVRGDVLQVSPLVVKGFNADFDGDAMQFHVPTTDEAVREAYDRMLPSRSLLSPADFKTPVHAPMNEYVGGLYHATGRKSARRPRVFRNKADVVAALERGDVMADDPVQVLET